MNVLRVSQILLQKMVLQSMHILARSCLSLARLKKIVQLITRSTGPVL